MANDQAELSATKAWTTGRRSSVSSSRRKHHSACFYSSSDHIAVCFASSVVLEL